MILTSHVRVDHYLVYDTIRIDSKRVQSRLRVVHTEPPLFAIMSMEAILLFCNQDP